MNEIFKTYYHSPIGYIQIAGTEEYISEASFLDTTEIPNDNKNHLPPLIIQCVDQFIQFFNGERRQFELPLNQDGTAFQKIVWTELVTIPYGKKISYLDLAKKIGDANATRAVANANGKNNITIIVPCHRVIGTNQELTGYSGGLWRKKWLLEHEAKVAHGLQTLF